MQKVSAAVVLLGVLAIGCGSPTLTSLWQDRAMDDEGRIGNWAGATATLADGASTGGVLHAAERLFLLVRPETPAAAMSLYRSGFTIWLGEGDARHGLRFPVETPLRREDGMEGDRRRARVDPGAPPDSGAFRLPPPRFRDFDRLDATGEAIDGGRLGRAQGVEIVVFDDRTRPAVQVAIDLVPGATDAIAVDAAPGDRIRVGLATPETGRPDFVGREGGGPRGGGSPGGGFPGGGRGDHRGGPPGGGRLSDPKGFDVSAKVVLASARGTSPR